MNSILLLMYIFILALTPPTPWNIHGFNTSETSLVVDWSNVPGDLQTDFFIVAINQTRPYYHYDFSKEPSPSSLRIISSSMTSINVSNLPVYSQHVIRVYLVDVNGDVYKSERTVVETDEGGKCVVSKSLGGWGGEGGGRWASTPV